jgi:hypothetical protein
MKNIFLPERDNIMLKRWESIFTPTIINNPRSSKIPAFDRRRENVVFEI